jgi:hypothetical protein
MEKYSGYTKCGSDCVEEDVMCLYSLSIQANMTIKKYISQYSTNANSETSSLKVNNQLKRRMYQKPDINFHLKKKETRTSFEPLLTPNQVSRRDG